MWRWGLCVAVVWFMGCAGETEPTPQTQRRAANQTEVKVQPPKKLKFDDVPAGVAALLAAGEQQDFERMAKIQDYLQAQGAAAVRPLAEVMNNAQANLPARLAATQVLGRIGKPAEDVLKAATESPQPRVQVKAIERLGKIKPLEPANVTYLIGLVDHSDLTIRRQALRALKDVGKPAATATKKLNDLLNDPEEDEMSRGLAKEALRSINPRRKFFD